MGRLDLLQIRVRFTQRSEQFWFAHGGMPDNIPLLGDLMQLPVGQVVVGVRGVVDELSRVIDIISRLSRVILNVDISCWWQCVEERLCFFGVGAVGSAYIPTLSCRRVLLPWHRRFAPGPGFSLLVP